MPSDTAADVLPKKKILVITSRFPYPLEKGDKLRIFNQLYSLAQTFSVTLVALNEEPITDENIAIVEQQVDTLYIVKVGGIYRLWSLLKGIFQRRPFQLSYFYSSRASEELTQIIKQEQPDLIYAHLLRSAQYVLDANAPVAVDYMDAFSLIMKRRAAKSSVITRWFYKLETRWMEAYEAAVAPLFDLRTIISQQDGAYLRDNANKVFETVPNGVDYQYFKHARSLEKSFDIVFVGNMGYEPNIRAAHYLVEQILPLILVAIPDLKVLIAGARPVRSVEFLASEHVAVSGWIDDIREAYASSKIMVAPIFSGAGQQNKILEAMSMGLPCITTSQVNNAIGATVQQEIEQADTPEEFAKLAIHLLKDKKYHSFLSQNARNFVLKSYSWETSNDLLITSLKKLIK